MFEHLVRDGVILFLIGITVLTKIAPALRLKFYSDRLMTGSVSTGWVLTVVGFISMIAGVFTDSW